MLFILKIFDSLNMAIPLLLGCILMFALCALWLCSKLSIEGLHKCFGLQGIIRFFRSLRVSKLRCNFEASDGPWSLVLPTTIFHIRLPAQAPSAPSHWHIQTPRRCKGSWKVLLSCEDCNNITQLFIDKAITIFSLKTSHWWWTVKMWSSTWNRLTKT